MVMVSVDSGGDSADGGAGDSAGGGDSDVDGGVLMVLATEVCTREGAPVLRQHSYQSTRLTTQFFQLSDGFFLLT